MRVLLVGAGGFVGRHTAHALAAQGHAVATLDGRLDWAEAHRAKAWLPLLGEVDAAIYLPGSMRDRMQGRSGWLERLHHHAPAALAEACVLAGVPRLTHVSVLCRGNSAYARTKRAGDAAVQAVAQGTGLIAHVVQPSLVLGEGGITSRQLEQLSRLPVWPLPAAMQRCQVQPLRVEDLADALVATLGAAAPAAPWHAVGPETDALPHWLQRRRAQRGQRPARVLTLPDAVAMATAALGDHVRFTSWSRETWVLMAHDSASADPRAPQRLADLLGRPLRPALEGAW
jgi:uncharacterized protein YbjT (DUF2867 family)